MFEEISILAPGLLGASAAMAVKARGVARRVSVWARRPEARLACEQQDWCDAVHDTPEAAVSAAGLVIVCTPVGVIPNIVGQIAASLPGGAIVTDVGSTKSLVCRRCHPLVPEGRFFVGAHPMAGSEKTGMDHADGNLFQGRPCFVTPLADTDARAAEQVVRFWKALGMMPVTETPERHDEIVAQVSHLPHVLASVLCSHLAAKDAAWRGFSGSGLRDTTRVAAGSPQLWNEIIEQNREEILRAIGEFEGELHTLKSAIANKQEFAVLDMLKRGKQYRDRLNEE